MMGDANCPECGGGYQLDEGYSSDGDIITATCRDCKNEFDVEVRVETTYWMA